MKSLLKMFLFTNFLEFSMFFSIYFYSLVDLLGFIICFLFCAFHSLFLFKIVLYLFSLFHFIHVLICCFILILIVFSKIYYYVCPLFLKEWIFIHYYFLCYVEIIWFCLYFLLLIYLFIL